MLLEIGLRKIISEILFEKELLWIVIWNDLRNDLRNSSRNGLGNSLRNGLLYITPLGTEYQAFFQLYFFHIQPTKGLIFGHKGWKPTKCLLAEYH